jgi:hypothetical protein
MDLNLQETFGIFTEPFKKYEEGKGYMELSDVMVGFDSVNLELVNIDDIENIVLELNKISRKMFVYGVILEGQNRILQKLEDEFDVWMAGHSVEVGKSNKDLKSEVAKENLIKNIYKEDYAVYTERIRNEKYRKGLIEKVVKGLDSFSYKLHSILSHKQEATKKF